VEEDRHALLDVDAQRSQGARHAVRLGRDVRVGEGPAAVAQSGPPGAAVLEVPIQESPRQVEAIWHVEHGKARYGVIQTGRPRV